MTTVVLPEPLRRYVEAQNRHDSEAMVTCFAPDALVHDEGRDYIGTDAIRTWNREASAKYRITLEPLACRVEGDLIVLVARISGTFDGSPITLDHRFRMAPDGRIANLDIG